MRTLSVHNIPKAALMVLPVATMLAQALPQSTVCAVALDRVIDCFTEPVPSILNGDKADSQQRTYDFQGDSRILLYKAR